MAWRSTTWTDEAIEADDFTGGTPVRLTYPDGNIVIGKLSVTPDIRTAGNGTVMARIVTPHSGDTWMSVGDADLEVWVGTAFGEPVQCICYSTRDPRCNAHA